MLSIVAWGIFAARAGLPISKSHALLAGLAGAAFAGGGLQALQWDGWEKVIIGMVLSVILGGIAAFVIGYVIVMLAGASKPARTKRLFDRLSVGAACFLAFNHGLNDGQKFMGVFATTLLTGGAIASFEIPIWVILLCALTMALGTSAGGWRIIQTLGSRMTRLQSWQGFAAQAAAGCTIYRCAEDRASRCGLRCEALPRLQTGHSRAKSLDDAPPPAEVPSAIVRAHNRMTHNGISKLAMAPPVSSVVANTPMNFCPSLRP